MYPGMPPKAFGAHSACRPVSSSYASIYSAMARHRTVSSPTSARPENTAGAKKPKATASKATRHAICRVRPSRRSQRPAWFRSRAFAGEEPRAGVVFFLPRARAIRRNVLLDKDTLIKSAFVPG